MGLQVGDIIQDKYRIVRLLGQGGMGAVFEGENLLIRRRVAIKVLHARVLGQQGIVERFEREAQAAGRIGNDHILEVLDLGHLPGGDLFMVLEFLDGETLEERLKRLGRLAPKQLYPIARQLLIGLTAAHAAGIIHRDLKPDNVFVLREKAGQPDFVKIIDFGISKFTAIGSEMKMTATGAVMGTPYFMSPEQAKGSRDADARSDLYAVGVILFKATAGQVPFDAPNFNELLFKIVLSPIPRVSSVVPDIDPAFDDLVLRCMARDPAQRFQTARELVEHLDHWYSQSNVTPSVRRGAYAGLPPAGIATELAPNAPGPGSRRETSRKPSIPGSLHAETPSRRPASQRFPSGEYPDSTPRRSYPPYSPASSPASGSNQQVTAGVDSPAGLVTGGSWSNTGYAPTKVSSSLAWIVAGSSVAFLVLLGFGYLVWSTRRQDQTPLPPPVVVAAPSLLTPPPAVSHFPVQAPPQPVLLQPVPAVSPVNLERVPSLEREPQSRNDPAERAEARGGRTFRPERATAGRSMPERAAAPATPPPEQNQVPPAAPPPPEPPKPRPERIDDIVGY